MSETRKSGSQPKHDNTKSPKVKCARTKRSTISTKPNGGNGTPEREYDRLGGHGLYKKNLAHRAILKKIKPSTEEFWHTALNSINLSWPELAESDVLAYTGYRIGEARRESQF